MKESQPETYCPTSRKDWRRWLTKNHKSAVSVWLLLHKKETGKPSIEWSDAVEEALCFGWIDGKRKTAGDGQFMQFFCKRKPNGTWSKINKEKIKQLINNGLMTQAGLDCIEAAKQNGSWTTLDAIEELMIPEDLEKAFKSHKGSMDYFMSLSKSVRKMVLYWVISAKREETRSGRITEVATLAARQLKPKQFR
jgi:uncharacterized protein YdeI (YjbR/CyaY-like superfamily)